MKIYISGKITGDRRYKAKFREVEKKLAAAGHIVLNPATAPEGLRPVDYMRLCFAMMEAADVVLFMQNYQNSRGAVPKERWQEAAKNLEELGNVLAAGFLKQNKDGRGKEDADALMADIVLACMALHHVAEFATDKCRIIPLPGKDGG